MPQERVRAALLPLLDAHVPGASAVGFEHVWGGPISLTRDARPWFGEICPGVVAFAGCNGSGIAKGAAYGRRMAELACRHRGDLLDMALREPRASWMPPEPLRRWIVMAGAGLATRRSGAEV